jgi:Domain of unknown function (DUF4382)/Domain of unknown function (DUF5666)
MLSIKTRLSALGFAATWLAACGGGGGSSPVTAPTSETGQVSMLVSDASTEDWATIGVKVLSIALVPQGNGDNVTVYTAGSTAPMINLAQLDQISEILGNVSVPVGTYTGAVITVSGNASDILLIASSDPSSGFDGAPGATVPSDQIQVQHTQGSGSNLTVPVDVNFVAPLVVSSSQNNALDLEFNLDHPAFLVGHLPPSANGNIIWAVNFTGPVRHHPVHDLKSLVLRHAYGSVTAVASDNTSITIAREFATIPVVTPEVPVSSSASLTILADATNGTLFYDVDAKSKTVIKDFSAETSLAGKQVRIAARYQDDGTLVATRIWASSTFNSVWFSPEGHVLHVDATNDTMTVLNETGAPVKLSVDANTQFFFRTPQNAQADSTPIATGTAFLSNKDLVRGFKVHASVVDVTATPLVAQSVDIEVAKYDGKISAPDTTGFTYSRVFRTASDDYQVTLDYIAGATANGTDDSGAAISGYKWWNFAYPTELNSGSTAIANFAAATNASVDFGGSVGAVPSRGATFAIWNDPASPMAWSAAQTVLTPSLLPLGFVANGLSNNLFTMTVIGGAAAGNIAVSTTSGSATLVYQIDRTKGIVTVSSIDIATSAGLNSLTAGLTVGAPVKVYGVPQADGSLRAYILAYYTGDTMPAQ